MIDLRQQVSQLLRLEDQALREMQREVSGLKETWTNVYSDYHTGGWQTLSLWNRSSKPTDTVIEDCEPVETSLLEQMPVTRDVLRNLGFRYMWVRLARLQVNAFMHEHRDYQELRNVRRLRLHIPVITNPFSSIVIDHTRVHLALGYVWKLNPIHRHAASNFGKEPRIHIIMDCYVDETLDALVQAETLDPICVYGLPPASSEELEETVNIAHRLAHAGDYPAAEYHILKMFHEYNLGEGCAYELVSRMYSRLGDIPRSELWLNNKLKFLQPAEAFATSD
ncbi:MAG TPA: aspartyl/asparaginyl beta-hydroxylase domain-containing protein [Pyrinomonadaceae bacterium]